MLLASFPSPSRSVWDLGPIPIRAYALCIIVGIIAAIWIGERRWVARGGRRGTVSDVAVWAVIFGLIGGRLYHVITDNELYFRPGRDPWRALYVWEGGLGVWGAIALGGVGAWIACRRRGIPLPPFADAVAPGIAVAQGLGRWGNYFNQELFGRPTNLPWAVQIDPDRPSTVAGATTYHPTFLYESLWDFGLAGVLIWADRRFRMGRGRVFALYVMGYTVGRVWIEMLRIDTANHVLGLRLNVWTSVVVFAGGLAYFLLHPGPRETVVEPGAPGQTDAAADAKTTSEPTTGTGETSPAGETSVGEAPPAETPRADEAPDAVAAADEVPDAVTAAGPEEPARTGDPEKPTAGDASAGAVSAGTPADGETADGDAVAAGRPHDPAPAGDPGVPSATEEEPVTDAVPASGRDAVADGAAEEPAEGAHDERVPAATEVDRASEGAAAADAVAEAGGAAEAAAEAGVDDEGAGDASEGAPDQRRRRLMPAGWRRR